jgi:uncharacterized iron-regulated membrane protein
MMKNRADARQSGGIRHSAFGIRHSAFGAAVGHLHMKGRAMWDHGGNHQIVTIAQAAGAKEIPPAARARAVAGILAMIVGILLLLMVVTAYVMVRKRRRRLAALKADTARRRSLDPWAEAGRRAETPSAEDLEDPPEAAPESGKAG